MMQGAAIEGTNRRIHFFQGEKWLALTGALGFVLAVLCAVWIMLYGGPVSPGGDVSKAFSFNAALGIFLLSTAAISPFAAMGSKSRAFFRWSYIMLALYAYAAENVQNFRGVNPRFVQDGTAFDIAVSFGFGFVALLMVICYLFLGVQYFRRSACLHRPELVLGIRYAMIAVIIAFGAGIWISMNQSRFTGLHGNIIWLHGLGFHALQAIPLVAWLTERTSFASPVRRRLIHMSGIAYILGLASIGYQTLNGNAILEWSTFSLLAGGCFLIAASAGAIAFHRSVKVKEQKAIGS